MMRPAVALACLVASGLLAGCADHHNFVDPAGPRHAGAYGRPGAAPAQRGSIKVVTFNVEFGTNIEQAAAELRDDPDLAGADILLLQEMDADGTDRIAAALGLNYVYYPASERDGSNPLGYPVVLGNAILTRGRILSDRKVVLPHANWANDRRRTATAATILIGGRRVQAFSVHTETPWMSLADRLDQARAITDAIDTGADLVVVGGDFNTLDRISRAETDRVFAEAGFERVSADTGGSLRVGLMDFDIDHIYARGPGGAAAKVIRKGTAPRSAASDHLPVWADLRVR